MTQTERRMTADEFETLKELVRWRRNHGVDFDFRSATLRLGDGRTIAWNTESALHWPRAAEIGVNPVRHRPLMWHEVESVTQAIDTLVALGYLPVRFSSAYRYGWDAANTWMKPEIDPERFRQMFQDVSSISFPALPAAW